MNFASIQRESISAVVGMLVERAMSDQPVKFDREFDVELRWAHVTGTTGRFVQFNFTVADPDLSVELVLPYEAFKEFCASNEASLSIEPLAMAPFERLKWLHKDASGEISKTATQAK